MTHRRPSRPIILTARHLRLIQLLIQWELAMSPFEFAVRWAVNYEQIAQICQCTPGTVKRWFSAEPKRRHPERYALFRLALADRLFSEQIPLTTLEVLDFPSSDSYPQSEQ